MNLAKVIERYPGTLLGLAVIVAADLVCFYIEKEWHLVWYWRFAVGAVVAAAVGSATVIKRQIRETEVLIDAVAQIVALKSDAYDCAQLLIDLKHHSRNVDKKGREILFVPFVLFFIFVAISSVATLHHGYYTLGALCITTGLFATVYFMDASLTDITLKDKETRMIWRFGNIYTEYVPVCYTGSTMQTDIDADNKIQTDIIQHFACKRRPTREWVLSSASAYRYVPSVRRVDNAHNHARSVNTPAGRVSSDSMILLREERAEVYNELLRARFSLLMLRVRAMLAVPATTDEEHMANNKRVVDCILAHYAVPVEQPVSQGESANTCKE